ncbi:mannose/glucose-specific lectin-like [Salvia divinorum]|uniref:Mannose/glucose-specific lectin-like n=1 Tax=Salvia divinorum TaxID=28513 RepID=A0ABD1FUL7_SALDI
MYSRIETNIIDATLLYIIVKCGLIIDSIAFGECHYSTKFGGNGGDKTFKINIDFPSEFLIGISGTHGSAWFFPNNVTSLTFRTNKTQYGPFGTKWGTAFSANADGAVVTGFHGRCGQYVEGIGLYVKPVCELLIRQPRAIVPPRSDGGREPDDGVFSAVSGVLLRLRMDSAVRFVGKKISFKARIKARIDENYGKSNRNTSISRKFLICS